MVYVGFIGNSPYFSKSEKKMVEVGATGISRISTSEIADYLMYVTIYHKMEEKNGL